MFCQKCGTQLDPGASRCEDCNTRTAPMKFCQKCGETMPADARFCASCRTASSVPSTPLQWLSLGLSLVCFIFFGVVGSDPYFMHEIYHEPGIAGFLTLPFALGAIVAVFITIPKGKTVLKVISIVIAAFLLLGSVGVVFF